MEISPFVASHSHSAHDLPSIRICDSAPSQPDRLSSSSNSSIHSHHSSLSHSSDHCPASPMSISEAREKVPPPLPPPRHIDDVDLAVRWGSRQWRGFEESGPATTGNGDQSSSGFHPEPPHGGGATRHHSVVSAQHDTAAKGSTSSTASRAPLNTDQGYVSQQRPTLTSPILQGEEPLRNATQNSVDQAYDKSLLQKIESKSNPAAENAKTSPRLLNASSSSASSSHPTIKPEPSPTANATQSSFPGLLTLSQTADTGAGANRVGSLPETSRSRDEAETGSTHHAFMDYRNPAREAGGSISSNASEPTILFTRDNKIRRSQSGSLLVNSEESNAKTSPTGRGSYNTSTAGDCEADFPMEENAALRQLHLGDRAALRLEGLSPTSKTGQKRRASSPPRESEERMSVSSVSGASDVFPRRSSGHLVSTWGSAPAQRSIHGSVSSTTSSAPRTGSYASSAGLSAAPSSMTSYSSHDRLSPGGISPSADVDPGPDPAFLSASVGPSPRTSISRAHQPVFMEAKTSSGRKLSSDSHAPAKQVKTNKAHFMCECCPKKPKRFDTFEELKNHEAEKQYACAYCPNRFKNKNEAERHQNSLHLRKHSWSCAALSGVEAAFHPSTSSRRNSTAQPYQGAQQQQLSPTLAPCDACGYCGKEFANPPHWDARVDHLTNVHKFGECNQTKKFFRADHFRQHLKHSHAGSSGKWTNHLENACMKDEPCPEQRSPGSTGTASTATTPDGTGAAAMAAAALGSRSSISGPSTAGSGGAGVSSVAGGVAGAGSGTGGSSGVPLRPSVISEEHDES